VAQVVEHSPGKLKALTSNASATTHTKTYVSTPIAGKYNTIYIKYTNHIVYGSCIIINKISWLIVNAKLRVVVTLGKEDQEKGPCKGLQLYHCF
jgi:hypothetical protein